MKNMENVQNKSTTTRRLEHKFMRSVILNLWQSDKTMRMLLPQAWKTCIYIHKRKQSI